MKIILKEDIKNFGKKGEIKEVKDGYAVNFLIPQGKVVPATKSNVARVEAERKKEQALREERLKGIKKVADKIKGLTIKIVAKAENEKLFGALSAKDIEEALEKEVGDLLGGKVVLQESIKKIGSWSVEMGWEEDVKVGFTVEVLEDKK